MFKNKRDLFNLSLLGIFVWLLIASYNSSKRKPESVGELLKDFSWLSDWPKWLDLPLMKWINKWFKALNENFGFIFEAINNFLLAMLMGLKNFLVQAPWPAVIIGVVVLTYFASGKKIKTTVAVGFCTFFIGFLHPRFWDKAIETTSIMLISIFLCLVIGVPIGIWMSRANRVREKDPSNTRFNADDPCFCIFNSRHHVVWFGCRSCNYCNFYLCSSTIS
jgi:glycine betaine/proline transport system permease protein